MNQLVLHDRTRAAVEQFLTQPSHGLLLVGQAGAGKTVLARDLIARILKTEKLDSYAYFLSVKPVKNSISIDEIRETQEFVKLRTTGQGKLRRAILVEDAHLLTLEAQNAFLKLLEEPPADTLIILTSNDSKALLPTILSRVQRITVQAPSRQKLEEHFKIMGYSEATINQAYYLSRGHIGLMTSLLDDKEEDHEAKQYVETAKQLLQAKSFERLTQIDLLIKQNVNLSLLLWALQRVSEAALQQAASKNATQHVKHWQNMVYRTLQAQDSLRANPQAKLLLTDLMLQA